MTTFQNKNVLELPAHATPVVFADGSLACAGALALCESLRKGSARSVSDLLNPMEGGDLARTLRGAGFVVSATVRPPLRDDLFSAVRPDLQEALNLKTDGFGLFRMRSELAQPLEPLPTFARPAERATVGHNEAPAADAAQVIQQIMRASRVSVSLAGSEPAASRSSLQFIAGQALEHGIQGFGFDGLPGKYNVSFGLHEVMELHGEAAKMVAEESARASLAQWADGQKVTGLSRLIGDSVQQRLAGSVSLASAQALVQAIESGSVASRAHEVGIHIFTEMMNEQGLDVSAQTVRQQAEVQGLTIQQPDRERGRYFGPVVAEDHRASLVKITRNNDALELPFTEIPAGNRKPKVGEAVAMNYHAGKLSVTIAKAVEQDSVGR